MAKSELLIPADHFSADDFNNNYTKINEEIDRMWGKITPISNLDTTTDTGIYIFMPNATGSPDINRHGVLKVFNSNGVTKSDASCCFQTAWIIENNNTFTPKIYHRQYIYDNGWTDPWLFQGSKFNGSVYLNTAFWAGDVNTGFSMTVSALGIVNTDNIIIDLNFSGATLADNKYLLTQFGYINRVIPGIDELTFQCFYAKPTDLIIDYLVVR